MTTKEEKIAKIEEFLKELEVLFSLNHKDGQDNFATLLARLKSFLNQLPNRPKGRGMFKVPIISDNVIFTPIHRKRWGKLR